MVRRVSALLLITVISCAFYYSQGRSVNFFAFKVVKLNRTDVALGISPKTTLRLKPNNASLINIALFAVDRRTRAVAGNSDVIIIVSINQTNGEVRIASLLRDTFVKIDGHGMNKINAAYAFGGPQLAIKTINQNFEMNIKDYINVDFYESAKIIDGLGGVNIKIEANEILPLNKYLDEVATYDKVPVVYIKCPGLHNLTGRQAVAYSRIRNVGNGDYDRTERQRNVLIGLFKKMKTSGKKSIPIFLKDILPNIETSMSNISLLDFAGDMYYARNKKVKQARFPLDNQGHGKKINNIWYLIADNKAVKNSLFNFIYK